MNRHGITPSDYDEPTQEGSCDVVEMSRPRSRLLPNPRVRHKLRDTGSKFEELFHGEGGCGGRCTATPKSHPHRDSFHKTSVNPPLQTELPGHRQDHRA